MSFLRKSFRLLPFLALLGLALWGSMYLSDWLVEEVLPDLTPQNAAMYRKIIIVSLLSYVVLMSIPFLPGAEVGLALLALSGGAMAPMVYLATVSALLLAFVIGRLIPPDKTAKALQGVGLSRAADHVCRMATTSPDQSFRDALPQDAAPWMKTLLKYRYVALAVLINMPGNVVLGGGGGLGMMAGLSRTFHPVAYLLTVAIAVLPVPFGFMLLSKA